MRFVGVMVTALVLVACGGGGDGGVEPETTVDATLTVTGPSLDGGEIPARSTCDGGDEVLPLTWSGIPDATEQIVVTVSDPDAPGGTFVHWMAILPAGSVEIGPGSIPDGAVEGRNGFGSTGYRGPCPPEGDDPHRYVVEVYAVEAPLDLQAGFTAGDLEAALSGAIAATGRLTASYGR